MLDVGSSVALLLGNRLESGCNIVFTHGARRAKVARSLTDARGGSNDARGCNIVFTHGACRAKVARSLIDARGSNDARGSPL